MCVARNNASLAGGSMALSDSEKEGDSLDESYVDAHEISPVMNSVASRSEGTGGERGGGGTGMDGARVSSAEMQIVPADASEAGVLPVDEAASIVLLDEEAGSRTLVPDILLWSQARSFAG